MPKFIEEQTPNFAAANSTWYTSFLMRYRTSKKKKY